MPQAVKLLRPALALYLYPYRQTAQGQRQALTSASIGSQKATFISHYTSCRKCCTRYMSEVNVRYRSSTLFDFGYCRCYEERHRLENTVF